jgi:lipopolysaccharide export system permease protein
MGVINRYITAEIIKFFLILMLILLVIYLAVDFFENIEDFLEENIPPVKIASFFLYKLPFVIAQMLPLCVLLSVIIVLGVMSRNNEIMALKSGGVSNFRLFSPIIVIGIVSSVGLFFLSEGLVPVTYSKANRIWQEEVKKVKLVTLREQNIWLKGNRRIIHIQFYKPKTSSIHGITIYEFDDEFNMERRLDARQGVYKERKWVLSEVLEQKRNAADGSFKMTQHDKMRASLDLVPDDFKSVIRKAEEMSFLELRNYVRKIEAEGYDATEYRVDLHSKIALPFVCTILCIIGAVLSIRHRFKGKLAVVILIGIGFSFAYWTLHSLCVSLGYGEMLPPFIAAWVTNILTLIGMTVIFITEE